MNLCTRATKDPLLPAFLKVIVDRFNEGGIFKLFQVLTMTLCRKNATIIIDIIIIISTNFYA